MKILMLNYEFPPLGGGAGNACYHMLKEFAKNEDLHIDLVTSSEHNRFEIERFSDHITIYKLNVGKKDIHRWSMIEIARWTLGSFLLSEKLVGENDYDLCHCWFGWPSGMIGYMLRKKMPYVVSLRGSDIPGYNPRLQMLDMLVFKQLSRVIWDEAKCVTTLSKNSSRMAGSTMDMKFNVIYNGVDTKQFYPEKKPIDGLNLLCVGRLTKRKGIDYVVLALEEIVKKYPGKKIHLTIVGSGNVEQELRSMVERLRLDEHVTFLGAIKHEDIPAIFRAHDIFILASVNEALSNVILEAIASGLAIITTDTGAAEFIDRNGFVVNKKDYKAIADKLEVFINDPGMIARFKDRSAEIARAMAWSDCSGSYVSIFEDIIKSRQYDSCISSNNRSHLS